MAQQQQNITIPAPGSLGLNTEDSPIATEAGYCTVADNAVIDKLGRIGSRKAFATFTSSDNISISAHPDEATRNMEIHRIGSGSINGTVRIVAVGKIEQFNAGGATVQTDYFAAELTESSGVWSLTEISLPTLTSPSALETCRIVAFNDNIYIFSAGNEAVVWDGTTAQALFTGVADTDYIVPQDDTGTFGNGVIDGDVATAGFGRLWVSGLNGDYNTVYYSDLLIGTQWYDGRAVPADSQNTGGLIDMSEYWPTGSDRIVAIEAHNNSLFVFGRTSILIWANAATGDPAAADGIFLQDTITNIGCIAQECVANTGSDVLFVDDTGVRSLGRTIQEKSVPLGDLTRNVRKDISNAIADTNVKASISLDYWPDEALVVCSLTEQNIAYVLDTRMASPSGGAKVTRWSGCVHNHTHYVERPNGSLSLMGSSNDEGVLQYNSFLSYDGEEYVFKYRSPGLTFGQPANLKFLRQIDYTTVTTFLKNTATARWTFDYLPSERTKSLEVGEDNPPAQYGVAEFGVDVYGGAETTIRRYRVNGKGSGELLVMGIDMDIAGNSFSLQEVNVQTLLGRII